MYIDWLAYAQSRSDILFRVVMHFFAEMKVRHCVLRPAWFFMPNLVANGFRSNGDGLE
jgi:UDP-glucose 4-epimerase